MKEIKDIKELDQLKEKGIITGGTYSTAKFALQQGTPAFVAFPDDEVDWKKFIEDLENVGLKAWV